jgi:hypothetical protein
MTFLFRKTQIPQRLVNANTVLSSSPERSIVSDDTTLSFQSSSSESGHKIKAEFLEAPCSLKPTDAKGKETGGNPIKDL